MNFRNAFIILICTLTQGVVYGQLKVTPIGRVHIGNEITANFDPTNVLHLSIFGRGTDPFRVGSKLSFGDFGTPSSGGANIFIGESGSTDTDILQLHGKLGISFTTGGQGNFEVSKFDGSGNLYVRGTVFGNSNVFSDFRLKKNIVALSGATALSSLLKLRGVQYDKKTDDDQQYLAELDKIKPTEQKDIAALEQAKQGIQKRVNESTNQIGFIAQEVQTVYPQLVVADEKGMLAVNYVALVPVLVEALKEQQIQIEALKKEVEDLKAKVKKQ